MELLLILIYAAFAIGIFKLFKIPVNGYSLLTAALGGAGMIALLVLAMNYNHPFSSEGRFYFATTPITPTVGGRVIEVPAVPNAQLKAGDVLFRIDPERYKNAVKAKEAQLADAAQAAKQLQSSAETARKNSDAAGSSRDAAKDLYDRSSTRESFRKSSSSRPRESFSPPKARRRQRWRRLRGPRWMLLPPLRGSTRMSHGSRPSSTAPVMIWNKP